MATSVPQNFWLLTPDGRERGPFVREQLLELAENGELAADGKVRASSESEWTSWSEYSLAGGECQVSAPDNFPVPAGGRLAKPLMVGKVSGRLGAAGTEFSPASAELRLLAGVTDLLLLAGWLLAAAWLCGTVIIL